jgi:diguanylate cyclase (GGDEF)-like protein
MREYLGVDVVANIVSMLRADVDGAIVLVDDEEEGQFYEKCAHQNARVVTTANLALQILSRINERQVAGVIAIVNTSARALNLPVGGFCPSTGDVASLLIRSKCCEQVLAEIGGGNWISAAKKEVGSLVDRIVNLAWDLVQIFGNAGRKLPLDRIDQFVEWSVMELSNANLTKELGPTVAQFVTEVAKKRLTKSSTELLAECDGSLVISLLACATAHFRPRGIESNRQCCTSDLLGMMRLVFPLADLESDPMYWQLRAWERTNQRYPVLSNWRILDPLQVVLDQRYWESDLQRMLTDDPDRKGLTALKIDLDNFKAVNEALGHSGGDEAIRLACNVLTTIFSSVAEIYRRGGDELVALAPGHRTPKTTQLAEKLREAIERAFIDWGQNKDIQKPPTASIGLVDVGPGSSKDDVVRKMDEAQAQAKREGKNRVVCYSCS